PLLPMHALATAALSTLSLHDALPIFVAFLEPYKVSMILSVLLAVGSQAAALVGILLTRSVVGALHGHELHRLKWLVALVLALGLDRKSTRLNSSHVSITYAVFCLKKK